MVGGLKTVHLTLWRAGSPPFGILTIQAMGKLLGSQFPLFGVVGGGGGAR